MYNRIFLIDLLQKELISSQFIKTIFLQRLFWFEPRYTGDDLRLGICLQSCVFAVIFLLISFISFSKIFLLFLFFISIPISLTCLSLFYCSWLLNSRQNFTTQYPYFKNSFLFSLWNPYEWKVSFFSEYGTDYENDLVDATSHFFNAWQSWNIWWKKIPSDQLEEVMNQWYYFISQQPKEIIQAPWSDNQHPLFELWKTYYLNISSIKY